MNRHTLIRRRMNELMTALVEAVGDRKDFRVDAEIDIEEENDVVFFEELAYGIHAFDIMPLLTKRWDRENMANFGDSHLRNLHHGKVKYYPIGEYDGDGAINFNPTVITQFSPIVEMIFPNMNSSADSKIIMRLTCLESEEE